MQPRLITINLAPILNRNLKEASDHKRSRQIPTARIISVISYSALFALGMMITTWQEFSQAQDRAPLEIIDAIITNAQAVSVAAAGFAAL